MTMSALTLTLLLLAVAAAAADLISDGAALLGFITHVPHAPRIHWNTTASPCDWTGVTCDTSRTAVITLRLPGAGLVGPIPAATLSRLSSLRVLSLHSNALSGPIPADISNLTLLRSLYLQNNLLSAPLPVGLSRLGRMTRLDVSNNNLSGAVPFALNNLTHLTGLFLQHNSFSGSLPSISIQSLSEFDVSKNQLNGSVPASLQRFPASAFAGNLNLCGDPLPPCTPFFPQAPAPAGVPVIVPAHKKKKNLHAGVVAAIAAGALLILLLLLLFFVFIIRRRKSKPKAKPPTVKNETVGVRSGETGMSSSSMSKEEAARGGDGEKNRLTFVGKGGGYSFDLEDLLRASAEVLGKGTVGTSYKAVLEEGTTVVVKRLKEVAATKREFEQQMEALGRVEVQDNPNILPLRAYYYSKDEKLLVFDYLAAGSLSALLHGSRGSGRTPLDWESRMRVALAAGRGLAHLHSSSRLVHGNLKASNVLLRDNPDSAALSDYGLVPLFVSLPRNSRTSGYRAPELVETRKPTYKSDVYSLGVLLLELLTGKAPNQASIGGEEGIDLPRWVQSVVREEWTAEVFDVELMRYQNIEEEMVQLLQIAMACVSVMPESRPEASVVVRMMEDIVRRAEQPDEGLPGSSDEPSKGGTPPAATP